MIPVRSKRLWHAVLAFLLLCSLIIAMWPGLTTAQNLDQSGQLLIPMEWDLQASVPNGANPYDVDGSVTFRHSSGATRTTGIFYDGDNTWKFRFTGDQTGQWTFTTQSEIAALNGQQGTVTVTDSDAPGFVASDGNKWIRTGVGEAFIPQFVMYENPDDLTPAQVDADIDTFLNQHGFTGFHVSVYCRWFDIRYSSCSDSDSTNPDPRTFEALEMLITKTYEAGGTVHLWMYGDSSRKQNPTKGKGGLNNEADRRVQRYLAARLGPLPGWTMGYGYDVFEWANTSEVEQWHDYLQNQMGWEHYLGARYRKNVIGQWSDKLEYAAYEQHRPSYDTYVETIEEYADKPAFSEDRFRIRPGNRQKDYDEDDTRQGLWRSAMAGGVANIWGNLTSSSGSSMPYSNAAQIKTYSQFFADRFTVDLERCNTLTDGVCLKRPQGQSYLFYKEDTSSIQLNLSDAPGSIQAIAVDTKAAYEEIDVNVTRGEQTWQAPYTSDWALAIRTMGGPAPTSEPTVEPTAAPTQTAAPTNEPTAEPTQPSTPTSEPTVEPTAAPTQTAAPTNEPTAEPTATPPGSDQAYEAESSRNDLVGDARIGNCDACSEGKRVQFVGSRKEGNNPWSGQLTFNEIMVPTAGTYTLVIDYVNGSNRTRTSQLQINEAAPIEISFPSRGTWRDIQVTQVEQVITLEAGSNRLTFSGETPGPDFDRIVVQSSGDPNPTNTAVVEPTDTHGLIRGLNGVEDDGSVSGIVAIEADISGDAIDQVVFELTGPESKTHTERKRPYYFLGDRDVNGTREPIGWDTTTYPDGDYQLIVTATDNSGQNDSIEVNFSVDNNANPEPTATNEPLPTSTPDPTAEPTAEPTEVPEPPVGGNNLPASAATYMGGGGDDEANAVDVAPKGNIFMAGVMPGHNPGGVTSTELLGGGSGAIVRTNGNGQAVLSVTRIGDQVNDLESNNDGRVATCGDFGVATLNTTASEALWHADSGSAKRCSIGADGTVAAIVDGQAQVYNRTGDRVGSWSIGGSFQEDIAVDSANNLIIATGFTNKRGGGNPVQVAFIKAWRYNGQSAWTSYDFSGSDAARTSLMADTRGYRVTIGGDGKLYFAAESAGGNTIFTRDPDSIDQQVGDRQVKTDNYTNPFNTRSNHITWYGRYNPANGDLEQGQIVLARLSSGAGNTIRPRGIDADVNGTVYVSGVSACCIANRDNQQLGGQSIDGYSGGESYLLIVSPNLRERLYWTPFPGGGDATVAVRNGQAAFATTANEDKLVTLNAIQDNPGNLSDAYLTVVE